MYKIPNPIEAVRAIGRYASRLPEQITYRKVGLSATGIFALGASACSGGDGNGEVRTMVPDATNTPPAVMRTVEPSATYTPEATATPDYCDLKRINESDSYLFAIYPDGWQIVVPYKNGSQTKLKLVGNFGDNGREIYREVLGDLNGQFTDANLTLRLDPNKKSAIIEHRLDGSSISVYQKTDGSVPPTIPASAFPEGLDIGPIISKVSKISPPVYCGPVQD